MAPEVIAQQSYDFKADVWSAMVVIYILFTAEMPFYGDSYANILEDII